MKKIIGFVFILGLLQGGIIAHAQMMMGAVGAPTSADTAQTSKDEAAGKAVWDKLQDKKVACTDLTDDDFDVLGDFFMGNMAGGNHTFMNSMMAQRLGDAGEKQMHIALGKRLSGCDTGAAFPSGASYFTPMMNMGSTAGMWTTTASDEKIFDKFDHVRGVKTNEGSLGTVWIVGWLFSIGYLGLSFWKGVLALIIWPYFLGKKFNKHD